YQRNAQAVSQSFPQSSSLYNVQFRGTQTVFNAGVWAAMKGARLVRNAANAQLKATIDAALLDVRTRFYTVLLDREKVRVQEENVQLFRHQLGDSRNQFQAGTVSSFEVLRARVSLANALPDLITARNDYRVSLEQLRQSLGVPSGPGAAEELPEVTGSLEVKPATIGLQQALASARAHRPELVELERTREAEEEAVKNAKAGYYPTASLFGEYEWDGFGGFAAPASSFGEPEHAHGWLFGIQSNWAIFDGRATAGRVRQARSQLEQARLSESSEDLAIDVEVHQDYSTFEQARELVDATRQTVAQAKEALRLANERFHVGSATQLDVLTSQVALTQARTNQLQANYNYLVALATLRKAMGLGDALLGG
ncbi:MAG: TolC family protein, partial [Opitutaceae bacterium]